MRIAYVLTSLGVGGAERQALALAAKMAERGHTVAILVLQPQADEECVTALRVVYLGMRKSPASFWAALRRGRRFFREFRPDVAHSHSFHANVFTRVLKILDPRVAVVSSIHNMWEGGWPRMLAYRLTDRLACRTALVGNAVLARFVCLKAVSARRSVTMGNGVDPKEFAPCGERRKATREAMQAGDAFVWLTAGRLAPAKDYPNLLRAFRRVLDAFPEARLWIAGGGDGAALHALSVELGLAGSIRWLGLRRAMPALLDGADGFVLGSAWEGMPLAVAEAMAMEKTVVATDVGSVRELLGESGWLAPARSAEALASAMLEAMRQHPEQRQALGRAARERVLRTFSIDAKCDEWEALYGEIAAGR